MLEGLSSSCPCHTGGIFLHAGDDGNLRCLAAPQLFKFIPQYFVFLTLLNIDKEVKTSAAHFVVEINKEEEKLACLHRAGCKQKFLRKFLAYSYLAKHLQALVCCFAVSWFFPP